ncbi:Pyrroline-5-carboxylate reductase [Posidoniimonas polymericola]|uniref:Pyrroline-5-carboxylate reductase n=1 Tax=Posidoniimonas polymericola TaxID=2528002 RepID=A0A5C5YSF8_9BACT|nr:pyrroline-5-carboxylate reductase [Posidoniimonas polymericola]TWT77806.1 Pyrroline-5-carboxylate reductase [Posidoniimonas polymericola]
MISGKIGFIGAGKMASAIAQGVVRAGVAKAGQISASARTEQTLAQLSESIPGVETTKSNTAVAEQSDLLILSIKPQVMATVLPEIRSAVRPQTLVVSVAAGVTLEHLAKAFKRGVRLVRVMPNTPCLIGKGACAFALGEHATEDDARLVETLLGAVGEAYPVPEHQLDAVTGVSGSGPAYVYTVIEAIADAGVRAGLPRAVAAQLAARTVAGAAEMVISTGKHPAVLRDEVVSPGGTTAAGLAALERCGVRHALAEAVTAATERSRELGQSS